MTTAINDAFLAYENALMSAVRLEVDEFPSTTKIERVKKELDEARAAVIKAVSVPTQHFHRYGFYQGETSGPIQPPSPPASLADDS